MMSRTASRAIDTGAFLLASLHDDIFVRTGIAVNLDSLSRDAEGHELPELREGEDTAEDEVGGGGVSLFNGLVTPDAGLPGAADLVQPEHSTPATMKEALPDTKSNSTSSSVKEALSHTNSTPSSATISSAAQTRMIVFVAQRMWDLCHEVEQTTSKTAASQVCKQMAVSDCEPVEQHVTHQLPKLMRTMLVATALRAARHISVMKVSLALKSVQEQMSEVGLGQVNNATNIARAFVIEQLAHTAWLKQKHLVNNVTVSAFRAEAAKNCPRIFANVIHDIGQNSPQQQNTTLAVFLSNQEHSICSVAVSEASRLVLSEIPPLITMPWLERGAKRVGAPLAVSKFLSTHAGEMEEEALKKALESEVTDGVVSGMKHAATELVQTQHVRMNDALESVAKAMVVRAKLKLQLMQSLAKIVATDASNLEYSKNKNMMAYRAKHRAEEFAVQTITQKAARHLGITDEGTIDRMQEAVGNATEGRVQNAANIFLETQGREFLLNCTIQATKAATDNALRVGIALAVNAANESAFDALEKVCIGKTIVASMTAAVDQIIGPAMQAAFKMANEHVTMLATRMAVLSTEYYITRNADEWSMRGVGRAAGNIAREYLNRVGIEDPTTVSHAVDAAASSAKSSGEKAQPAKLLKNATIAARIAAKEAAEAAIDHAVAQKEPIWHAAFDKAQEAANRAAIDAAAAFHERNMANEMESPTDSEWMKQAVKDVCTIAVKQAVKLTRHEYRRQLLRTSEKIGKATASRVIKSVRFKRDAVEDAVKNVMKLEGAYEARISIIKKCPVDQMKRLVQHMANETTHAALRKIQKNGYPYEAEIYPAARLSVNQTIRDKLKLCQEAGETAATNTCLKRVKATRNKNQLATQPTLLRDAARMVADEYAYLNAGPLVRQVAHLVAKEESPDVGLKAANVLVDKMSIKHIDTVKKMVESATEAARKLILHTAASAIKRKANKIIADNVFQHCMPHAIEAFKQRLMYEPQPVAFSMRMDPVSAAQKAASEANVDQTLRDSIAGDLALVVATSATEAATKAGLEAAITMTAERFVHEALLHTEHTEGKRLADICTKAALEVAVDEANMVLTELMVMNYKTKAYTWTRAKKLMRRHLLATTLGHALRLAREKAKGLALVDAKKTAMQCTEDPKKLLQIEVVVRNATYAAAKEEYYSSGIQICIEKPESGSKEAGIARDASLTAAGNATLKASIESAEIIVHNKVTEFAEAEARMAAGRASERIIKKVVFNDSDFIATSMAIELRNVVPVKAKHAAMGAIKDTLIARALTRFHSNATELISTAIFTAMKNKTAIEAAAEETAGKIATVSATAELVYDVDMKNMSYVTAEHAAQLAANHILQQDAELRDMAKRIHAETMELAMEGVTFEIARAAKAGEHEVINDVTDEMSPAKLDIRNPAVRQSVLRECTSQTAAQIAENASKAAQSLLVGAVSDQVYKVICTEIITGVKTPPGLLYEVETVARHKGLETVKEVGYPRALNLAVRTAKESAKQLTKKMIYGWIIKSIIERAVEKGRAAAQKVTSKATVRLVLNVLNATCIVAVKDVLNNLFVGWSHSDPIALPFAKTAMKAALNATTVETLPTALAAAFNGRRESITATIESKGTAAIQAAFAANESVEEAAWKVVATEAVGAAMRGTEVSVDQVAQADGYKTGYQAAVNAVVTDTINTVTQKEVPTLVEAQNTAITDAIKLELSKYPKELGAELVKNLSITTNKDQIENLAITTAASVAEHRPQIMARAVKDGKTAISESALGAAREYLNVKLNDEVVSNKGTAINIYQSATAALTVAYTTHTSHTHLFFGRVVVPFLRPLHAAVAKAVTDEDKEAMRSAALHAVIDSVAKDTVHETLREIILTVAREEGTEAAQTAKNKVSGILFKCGHFDVQQINSWAEAASAEANEVVQRMSTPSSFEVTPNATLLLAMVSEKVLAAATRAAEHASSMKALAASPGVQATAMSAAQKEAHKYFQQLAHEVVREVADSVSTNKAVTTAVQASHSQLMGKLMEYATPIILKNLEMKCMKAISDAAEAAVEKAAAAHDITHAQVVHRSIASMKKRAWDVVNGPLLLDSAQNHVMHTASQVASMAVTTISTKACKAGKEMEKLVMQEGLAEVLDACSSIVTSEATKFLNSISVQGSLEIAASETLKLQLEGIVDSDSDRWDAHVFGNVTQLGASLGSSRARKDVTVRDDNVLIATFARDAREIEKHVQESQERRDALPDKNKQAHTRPRYRETAPK